MDSKELEIIERIEQILMPYATARREQLHNRNGRLVHYTSAENAIKILYSKQVWMRNAKCMADYMEVSHGHQMLLQFFSQPEKRESFCKALNNCHPNVGEEALHFFDEWWRNNIQFEIYVTSISEHDDSEDSHGRLSMWRAFGRVPAARAAIVMKLPRPEAVLGLRVTLSPVAYFDYDNVEKQLKKVISNIKKHKDFLKTLDKERLRDAVFITLLNAAVSLKHEGFREGTRLSCRTFAANAVRLELHALAYNLGNFMRTLALPKTTEPWSLTSLREKLIKIGAKVVSHGRYVTFQLAEVAGSRQMFADIVSLIARLRAPPAPA